MTALRTSIATVCLSGTLDEKLQACAAAGFDGVEIFEPDLVVSPLTPAQVRDRCAELGLTIDLYQPLRDLDGVSEDLFAANLRRAEAKFALMRELGATLVLVCTNVATATVDDDQVCADQLRRLGDLADRYDVSIAYEALAWGRYVNDFEHAARIVALADHPRVGTCLDSFHILSRRWDPSGIESLPTRSIFFVQLADAPDLDMDVLSWSRHHRLFPGQGSWDLAEFVVHLFKAGYAGPLSLEIFNDTFRQSDVQRTAVDAHRSLVWLADRAARRMEAEGLSAPVDVPALPPVDDPSAISFVEVRSPSVEHIESLLRAMGFTDHGRHRSKPAVSLWTLDDARVVLNQVDGSVGDEHIASIGFTVADPAASAARAEALQAVPVARETGAGDEELRAVTAPDGTEVFFVGTDSQGVSAWVDEFSSPARSSGEIHVDHVNLAQPWQHFDEAVLFLGSVLSLTPRPSVDVASPLGLVRSQVMDSDDHAIRLALNVVPPISAQGADPGQHFAQHVAFHCNDIVAFARAARDRGLSFLAIPENYYADLAARFDLSTEELETLRSLDLLYDRDDSGEFVHFYTETVGSIFLEVVERRGGYDGFGAPNAPVRLATQHARRLARGLPPRPAAPCC
ncbi:bifunctional sugar phosphate isomerase/epimerase/4-hydroxyphenylpyruvate dioxygenase family protein [Arsenicicoccus piscis]|uniref:bifunctional sugar phosphate isomerase/epimerase/4-hydroxyphenylpyruvate dioxygenase family protein n=1 Tax=Arsenicicoccus piscis TaxID=673954 RepID=UPI0030C708B4